MTKQFYAILANSLVASLTNTLVWFAVTFWVYLETRSVIATSIMAGVYLVVVALSGFALGSLVDHHRKKSVMALSTFTSLVLYTLACILFVTTAPEEFRDASSLMLWAVVLLALFGAMAGNLRGIALSALVTYMVAEEERDRANGMVGTANGVAFLAASIFSGLAIGYVGAYWMFVAAIVLSALTLVHLWTLTIPDRTVTHGETKASGIDLRGTIRAVGAVPGLFALILFHTFNNFLGGVFMSLMDPYGLSLVSVQMWGTLWGLLSLGFIVGGLVVAKRGLGTNPLRTFFQANILMWAICCVFALQASVVLLTIGMFIWLCLAPVIEAAEQTILQKVVPPERQGRVFGFAQSVEQSASPITAFIIGPIAQLIFIPFMTTGAGVEWIGAWFGTGDDRGIALVFTVTGIIGLIVTLLCMRTSAYKLLSKIYQTQDEAQADAGAAVAYVQDVSPVAAD